MKVIVTGAAGFLGYHLCNYYLSRNISVVGIDNFVSGQKENIDDLKTNPNFKFVERDIIDLDSDARKKNWPLFQNATRIFHMACPASPPVYQKNPLHTLDTCYVGSRNIFELAKELKARVLIASTSEIYGDPEVHPQPESYRGNVNTLGPRSCYDEGKRVMETLGHIYTELGVEVRTARIFNTYGPRMSPFDGRVITNFISQALRNEDLTIYGDGSQTRSFCFFSDLVKGLVALMESNVVEAVNLGSQFEFTITELASLVREIVNPAVGITHMKLPIDDPKQRRPNTEKARTALGWQPEVELSAGIKILAESFRKIT